MQASENQKMTKEIFRDRWLPALAVMVTVVISATTASYSIGSKVGKIEARLSALEMFAGKGDRWTAKEGIENRRRIDLLQKELKELPPKWFVKQHDETRHEVKALLSEVSKLEQAVHDLMQIVIKHREEAKDARENH